MAYELPEPPFMQLTWSHLDSLDLTWIHVVSLDLTS